MPYSFNPFTGNFDNTPSTLNGDSAYSNVLSNSATWTDGYQTGTVYKANSATYATINFANGKFFALSGGLISGNTRINGDVTIFGNLTSTGTQTFANTIFSTTSALSVVHVGSGPAVWIGNNGSGDIASFYDIDQGIEVFHIGGTNGDFPNVGVKTSAPNKDFTVKGEISATGDIWTTGRILSGNQELASIFRPDIDKGLSVFNTVQSNSATNWNYQGTDLKNLSASWVGGNAAFTNLVSNSAAYLSSVDLSFLSVSADWNSVYNTVLANSAVNWNYQGTDLKDLSANWQSTLTTVSSNSAKWESVYSNVNANSATYATVNFVEANFLPLSGGSIQGNVVASGGISIGDQLETATLFVSSGLVGINTELPNEALTVVGNVSSTGIIYSDNGTSDQWNSVYSNVNANSAVNWNYQGDDLKALSGSWQGTYTNYSTNSASYATSNFVQSNFLPLSGGNVNGVFEAGSGSITLFVSSGIVGINTEFPNHSLTVVGNISSSNIIYSDNGNSNQWNSVYTTVQAKSATEWDNALANSYTHSNFLPLSGGTVSGSISASGVISASASNIKINVVNDSSNRIFTDADNNRVVHIDTTTAPLCAIFPSSLSNGFNVAIMNTGTNNLVLSAAQLNSAGTLITTRYGGAFVYKDSNNLFAVGRLV